MVGKSTREQIILSDEEHKQLVRIVKNPKSFQIHVWRARIILELASGCSLVETTRRTGKSKQTVWLWWDRFLEKRVEGLLLDAISPPVKGPVSEEKVSELVELAMSPPPENAQSWTFRALGERMGMHTTTVANILKTKGIRPRRVKTYKVRDIVGLYVNPHDHAVVLSEKTLLVKPKNNKPIFLNYNQSSTSSSAANPVEDTESIIDMTDEQNRIEDFLDFLDHIAKRNSSKISMHVILDNFSSQKSVEIHKWINGRTDWTFHFTPTSESWMNAVEEFFSEHTKQKPKDTASVSLDEFTVAIKTYIERNNSKAAHQFIRIRKP